MTFGGWLRKKAGEPLEAWLKWGLSTNISFAKYIHERSC
jgi:hypothetical protein